MDYGLRIMTPKPKPSPTLKAKPRKKKSNRKKLIIDLSNLLRKITEWRDGCTCVLSGVDGGRCSQVSQWGHVIPQGGSGYLKHNLSNSFRQCSTHNKLHNSNPIIYLNWYRHKFGIRAIDALEEASRKTYHIFSIPDLEQMKADLTELYENRHAMIGANIQQLVEAGYYGDIIREAWIKDGRI